MAKNICCQGNEITEWFEVMNYSASSGTNGTSEANFHLLSYTSLRPLRLGSQLKAYTQNPVKRSVTENQVSAEKKAI